MMNNCRRAPELSVPFSEAASQAGRRRATGRRIDQGRPQEARLIDCLLRQPDAARLLGVSVSYLRASTCPKRFLPSNGRGKKPLVRYLHSELLEWALAQGR